MNDLTQRPVQLIYLHRFRQVSVHPAFHRLLQVVVKSIGRHGDDRYRAAVFPLHTADRAGGLETVHDRHHDIHQDHIVSAGLSCTDPFHGLRAVIDTVHRKAPLLQQCQSDLRIQLIVFHDQNTTTLEGDLFLLCLRLHILTFFQQNGETERAAFSQFAVQLNTASHHLDQTAADRKTQARALLLGRVPVGGLLKGTEHSLLVFLCNTDSRITHRKIDYRFLLQRFLFPYRQRHPALCRGKLHRIAQQIDQHLADTHFIRHKPGIRHLDLLHEIYLLGRRLRHDQFPDRTEHLMDIEIDRFQLHLAALDLGHIQNVIDQAEQIIRG